MILKDGLAFYFEASQNKFFDYLAAGIPVICNYPGWVADIILDNTRSFIAKPMDLILIANGLIQIADDPSIRREMGVRWRSLAETQFDRTKLD